MSTANFIVSEEYEQACKRWHMSQAVRVGTRIETSGHGGDMRLNTADTGDWKWPDTLSEEISNAFENLENVLTNAGASWSDVTEIVSYHVPTAEDSIGDDHLTAMVVQMARRMPNHRPVWTCVGVPVLGEPEMHVEICVSAYLDE